MINPIAMGAAALDLAFRPLALNRDEPESQMPVKRWTLEYAEPFWMETAEKDGSTCAAASGRPRTR